MHRLSQLLVSAVLYIERALGGLCMLHVVQTKRFFYDEGHIRQLSRGLRLGAHRRGDEAALPSGVAPEVTPVRTSGWQESPLHSVRGITLNFFVRCTGVD